MNLSDEVRLVVNYEEIKYTEFFVNPSIQDEKLIHESILQEENLPNYWRQQLKSQSNFSNF